MAMSEFKQNIAIANMPIGRLVNVNTGAEITGGTVTGTFLLDGSSGTLSGTVAYDATAKMWFIDAITAAEINGLIGGYSFSHDDAVGGGAWIGIKTVLRLISEINLVAGQIVAVNDPGNFLADDITLEVMRQASKNYNLTITDANGDNIDMSSKNIRFIVESIAKVPTQVFKKETPTITISGDDNEIVTIPTISADNTQTEIKYNWRLWDQDDDTLYAYGTYVIAPASDNV